MKHFNRKKLIPSLAASVMVAAATLAPLPLAAGSIVHAYPAFPLRSFVRVENPGTFGTISGSISVELVYRCSPYLAGGGNTTTAGFATVTIAQQDGSASTIIPQEGAPAITCDGHLQETSVNVPAPGTPGENFRSRPSICLCDTDRRYRCRQPRPCQNSPCHRR